MIGIHCCSCCIAYCKCVIMCCDSLVFFVLFVILFCVSFYMAFCLLFGFRTLASLLLVRRCRLDDPSASLAVMVFCISSRDTHRRLAGHLFQDRWKDQGLGFIFLPPWPPNCLGHMLTVRDFSQHLVSLSKTIRPNIPRGARRMGHCEMMWSAVCSLAPHSQFVRGARPHLYLDEQKRPTPERRRDTIDA